MRALKIRALKIRAGKIRALKIRAGKIRAGKIRAGKIRALKIRAVKICALKIRAGKARVVKARTGKPLFIYLDKLDKAPRLTLQRWSAIYIFYFVFHNFPFSIAHISVSLSGAASGEPSNAPAVPLTMQSCTRDDIDRPCAAAVTRN